MQIPRASILWMSHKCRRGINFGFDAEIVFLRRLVEFIHLAGVIYSLRRQPNICFGAKVVLISSVCVWLCSCCAQFAHQWSLIACFEFINWERMDAAHDGVNNVTPSARALLLECGRLCFFCLLHTCEVKYRGFVPADSSGAIQSNKLD